ncbi:MAG: hypothetical protein PVI26_02365 [Chitinispirillia bacterium]|jgi:hypothetical protein
MNKSFFLILLSFAFFVVQAQNKDSAIVVYILEENNLHWDIEKRATFEEGNIILKKRFGFTIQSIYNGGY